jgi:hypothetical protein
VEWTFEAEHNPKEVHHGSAAIDHFDTSAFWRIANMGLQPQLGLWAQRRRWTIARHLADYAADGHNPMGLSGSGAVVFAREKKPACSTRRFF